MENLRIIRTKELAQILGVSLVTLWRWENAGVLPPRKKIGSGKAVGWLSSDVEEYLKSLPNVTQTEANNGK